MNCFNHPEETSVLIKSMNIAKNKKAEQGGV
jgi:hypothetical protein